MLFKNLKVYQLTHPLSFNDDDLQAALLENPFRACGRQETATMGFSSPFGSAGQKQASDLLFHRVENRYWLTLKKQERLLPASVVNAELAEKVASIEAETGSPVGKKQQADIKQEIMHALLPRAFTKNSFTHAYVLPEEGYIFIDSSSDGKAEALLAMLRKSLTSLPVAPLARRSIQEELTEWVNNAAPEHINLLEEAEFKSVDENDSVIRCKNQPLDSDEILNHISANKRVQKLHIEYNDALTCIICEDGSIKRIKFTDRIVENIEDVPKDDVAQRLDAEFALFSAELLDFVSYLDKTLTLTKTSS